MMKSLRVALASLLLALPLVPLSAAEPPIDPEVLALREAAWRAWFAGDEDALRRMLPAEFLGISSGPAGISGLDTTLKSSRGFKESGGKLVSLSFPETRAQRFGDTVILYGSYDATIFTGGAEKQLHGQLTEIFVKRDGKWYHPGWHLDAR